MKFDDLMPGNVWSTTVALVVLTILVGVFWPEAFEHLERGIRLVGGLITDVAATLNPL